MWDNDKAQNRMCSYFTHKEINVILENTIRSMSFGKDEEPHWALAYPEVAETARQTGRW